MAKKRARKPARKAAAARSAAGPKAGVDTGAAVKAMQKVLEDLKTAKRGGTGWGMVDKAKVKEAEILLKLVKFKLECPPESATQSFP